MTELNGLPSNVANQEEIKSLKEENTSVQWPKSLIIGVVVNVIFTSYFLWATYYFVVLSSETFYGTSCSGYGFLTILFVLVQFGVVFHFISHYILPSFKKNVWIKIVELAGRINYFMWATCSGYGLLTIIYSIILFGILLYFILPYISPGFKQNVWSPAVEISGKIKYGAIIFYSVVAVIFLGFLIYDTSEDRTRLIPLGGLCAYVATALLFSKNRKKVRHRIVAWGLILQFLFGLFTIRWSTGRNIFQCFGEKVRIFLEYAVDGAAFVYGEKLVHDEKVFAFAALAAIYFLSFIINILYYYNIMQSFVIALGRFFRFIMGTSTCESVYSATNVFLGMSESPLLIKPFLPDMTDAELLSIMTSGFATVAGSTLAAYIGFGANPADLITATIMSCPAALCISKLLYPETEDIKVTPKRVKNLRMQFDSVLDAASRGAHEASEMVIGIIAGLIATLSFVYFVNGVLSWMGTLVGFVEPAEQWQIETILGKIFIPVAYIMGVPWEECEQVGRLIGIKTIINEFVAFRTMSSMNLSRKSMVIATFSICGFANPGSMGIMISSMSTLVPSRKEAITRLVFRAFVGGCFSCLMTACVAGMLTSTTT